MDGNESSVSVLVVDDHPVVVDGVTSLLRTTDRIDICGYADSATGAVAAAAELTPNVVLLDLRLGETLASEIIPDLLKKSPASRILLFTAYPAHAAVTSALAAGAAGVLVKDVSTGDLVEAIFAVALGEVVPGESASSVPAGSMITAREYEVLLRAARGQSNPEIAEALFISRNTVKSYIQNILQKLGARNRVEAIARAQDLGLL